MVYFDRKQTIGQTGLLLWEEGRRLARGYSWEQINDKQLKYTYVPANLSSSKMIASFAFKIIDKT